MNELATIGGGGLVQYSTSDVLHQIQNIQELMSKAMKEGEHFGKIPGCGDKPTLLKSGAEKLNFMFRLAAKYTIKEKELSAGHREYQVITELTHIPTGQLFGQGVGSASTMETKWRYRNSALKCPECGKETIIKGKKEYGGGFICFGKKGGCNAKFPETDERITNQETGKIEYENPADYYNTVLKMAKKRSLVDASLTTTAASDIFTQDVEELIENGVIQPVTEKQQTAVERPREEMKQGKPNQQTKPVIEDAEIVESAPVKSDFEKAKAELKGSSWNGKVYANNVIYINKKKFQLTESDIEALKKMATS